MLDAVAGEDAERAVVELDRYRHGQRSLWIPQLRGHRGVDFGVLQRLVELSEGLPVERIVELRRKLRLRAGVKGGAFAIVLSLFG